MKKQQKILSTAIILALAGMGQKAFAYSSNCNTGSYTGWTSFSSPNCTVNLSNIGNGGFSGSDLTGPGAQTIKILTVSGAATFRLENPEPSSVIVAGALTGAFGWTPPMSTTPLVLTFSNATELRLNTGSGLDLKGGHDVLTNIDGSTITKVTVEGNLNTGAGNDTARLTNATLVNSHVTTGTGTDTLIFTDSTMTGSMDAEDDNDR